MTTPTDEINNWINEHGSTRDALNIAIARLKHLMICLDTAEHELSQLHRLFAMINESCPNCGAYSMWVIESSRNSIRCSYCNSEYNDDPRPT